MIRLARLAAALLPLAGLAALWLQSDRTFHAGTEWEVPIMGYDPRDYLRGHYVEFCYDWPGFDPFHHTPREALCLEGRAPTLEKLTVLRAGQPCTHPVRLPEGGAYGWEALERGRLYIGQDRAAQLEQQLRGRDQRGIVTIRQRADGSFTPISIRFRPLTPAERAARDAEDGAPGRQIGSPRDPAAPPPVMVQ